MTAMFVDTLYPYLREALDPRFATLSDGELEELFGSAFGEGITPAEYEEFFGGLTRAFSSVAKDVGRFAQQAAPVLASGATGALQGAAAGSALGPYGALAGALAGGVGSALASHGKGPAKDVGNVLSGVVNTAGTLTGRGGLAQGATGLLGMAGQLAGRGSPAAGQLIGMLGRPETMQALAALLRGRNTPVPVGSGATPVPAGAFAGLLGALAREAESDVMDDALPSYLLDAEGGLVVDPTDPDQRAARLLQLLLTGDAAEYDEWDDHDEYDDHDYDYDNDEIGA